jgi:hypothetical protein
VLSVDIDDVTTTPFSYADRDALSSQAHQAELIAALAGVVPDLSARVAVLESLPPAEVADSDK